MEYILISITPMSTQNQSRNLCYGPKNNYLIISYIWNHLYYVLFLNGISTVFRLFNAKAILLEEQ